MRWLWLALVLSACTRTTADAGLAVIDAGDDCTLATVLTPGIAGSPEHLIASERNPNGDSELAALMRMMQSDLEAARGTLLAGGTLPALHPGHRKIRCAWPTVTDDRNASFDANAAAYLLRVKSLDAATTEASRKAAYESVISGCLACHAVTCPGPIAAITPLRLP